MLDEATLKTMQKQKDSDSQRKKSKTLNEVKPV